MNIKNDPALKLFEREMHRRFGASLRQVILFGSKARGDDHWDSDYDCLVILDEVDQAVKEIIDEVAGDLLYEHNAVFSIFPISEHNHKKQKYNPFLINARNEGIPL
ncbi:MAG: nucleotidyltransferase domain-containing protein [Bacillota bacterium]|jgi:predicted nucleotidyltransferase